LTPVGGLGSLGLCGCNKDELSVFMFLKL
jgi:hypothetical protein